MPIRSSVASKFRCSLSLGLILSTAFALPALASDHDWPSFRGAFAEGVAADADLPTTWNAETGEGVAWKVEIPGLGHSSPVVWQDRIFITTTVDPSGESSLRVGLYGDIAPVDEKGPMKWLVMALDRSTGAMVWQKVAHEGVPKVKRHTKASHANSTPATDGEHLVVMLGSEGLHTFDLDGKLLWKKDLGVLDAGFFRMPTAQWGYASSPVIHDGKVLLQVDIQGDSYLAAFAVDSGKELWRTARDEVPTWGSPTVAPRPGGGWQVAVNGWKHIGGYDLATGKELWKMAGGGDIPVPTPIVANDLILITSAHGSERPIYAVKLGAIGDIKDSEHLAWQKEKAGNYMQTPIAVGDVGYFCLDNGVLGAYDLKSGENLFKERLGGGKTGFTASPVATQKHLYFTSEDGDVYVLGAKREFEQVAVNPLGETFMSTPAISGDLLLFRARRHLFAIGKVGAEPAAPVEAEAPVASEAPATGE